MLLYGCETRRHTKNLDKKLWSSSRQILQNFNQELHSAQTRQNTLLQYAEEIEMDWTYTEKKPAQHSAERPGFEPLMNKEKKSSWFSHCGEPFTLNSLRPDCHLKK
ncbi:hypothetical protein DPMN_179257 [Dreissena polymorpha]|uniref:Uncharacterized protein n=1 Tax=Dreissena polymorpha TaxID=45954 RepID=A0A9D4EET0_DREPO|nr:hypothetical protein DPMN_179257 [Dreissena polymorpha]